MNEVTIYSLNWVDYFIIGVILASTLISLMRGFTAESISLLTWIIAAVVAFKSAGIVSNLLAGVIHTTTLRMVLGFIIVLIIILIIGSIINHFLAVFIKSTGLSGTNRLLGMIFGFTRGILLIAILIMFVGMTSALRTTWWHYSMLIPHFSGIANWLQQFLPLHFPQFHSLTTNQV